MSKKTKISKDWPIAKLLNEYPESATLLMEHGFPCVGCALSQFETLEQGALAVHGMDEKFLENLLDELNKLTIKKQKSASNKRTK